MEGASSFFTISTLLFLQWAFLPHTPFTKEKKMFDQLIGYVKKFTEAGVALLAFGIVMQIIFGKAVPFVGGDIIGNITAIVATLGAQGLVGLAAVGVIYAIFTGQQK